MGLLPDRIALMRLVLIGDIHAYRLFVPPWALLSKRLLGQANLWLTRRQRFDHRLMGPLVRHALSLRPEQVLLSGDLTTTAIEGEFDDVRGMLAPLVSACPSLAVPGNHDRYTFTAARVRRMERKLEAFVPQRFPHWRELSPRWRLLALDAAVPRVINARGELGDQQLHAVRQGIAGMDEKQGLIVLCHYPLRHPLRAPPATYGHKLAESGRLGKILKRCRSRILYLHGHVHQPWCWQPLRSDHAHITYINAGAPCMTGRRYPRGQGYWQIDLPEEPWGHLGAIHHVPEGDGASVTWLAKRVL